MTDRPRSRPPLSLILGAVGVVIAIATITYVAWPLLPTLTDPAKTRDLITDAGGWGPVVFIGLHILQVLVAPIPGQAAVIAGGYLFGPLLGLAYALVGATIGTAIIIVLSRKLGRPFVTHFAKATTLERFDGMSEDKGPLVFFLIFLLPAFPDDVVAGIAGLTKIPIGTLILISVAGRLPGYAVLAVTGDWLTRENLNPVVLIAVVTAVVFALAVWKREWLADLIGRGRPRPRE